MVAIGFRRARLSREAAARRANARRGAAGSETTRRAASLPPPRQTEEARRIGHDGRRPRLEQKLDARGRFVRVPQHRGRRKMPRHARGVWPHPELPGKEPAQWPWLPGRRRPPPAWQERTAPWSTAQARGSRRGRREQPLRRYCGSAWGAFASAPAGAPCLRRSGGLDAASSRPAPYGNHRHQLRIAGPPTDDGLCDPTHFESAVRIMRTESSLSARQHAAVGP